MPKDCDKDVLFRDRVGGDQQLASSLVGASLDQGSSCSYPIDSQSPPTGTWHLVMLLLRPNCMQLGYEAAVGWLMEL
ncbi:hypothetical protein Nepgr_024031 [Nepenthes gracilis]|uniref:Uncharacterized protein n=1 Tax=Nepenthes gracilis TaxID=150966 RepID=A0AAD3T221_NEPGR|nr:hypothetical protein Nepgr_024031 [Nepenthes gracilis]